MNLFAELHYALRRHWPYYLTEAAGLAVFVTCSGLLTLALEHPDSPLHQWLMAQGAGPTLRRVPLGVGMGLVIVILTYNPWGKRSGAHINPAITLAFWQLGRIRRADALWYGLAQLAGGVSTTVLLKALLMPYYAHPSFHFGTTRPGPDGAGIAFIVEFVISFGLMLVLLLALRSARFKKAAGWLVGALLVVYVIWESPYSGMSLNPFRSLASAVAAGELDHIWVYLLAPPAAMWLAARLFQLFFWHPRPGSADADAEELPRYPDPDAT